MSLSRYSALVAAAAAATLAVLWPLTRTLGPGAWPAAAVGASLAVLNALAAYALVQWTASRPTVAFFRAILGGMLVRMTLMLAAVVVALRFARLPAVPFVVSLLGHFAVFLALETAVVSRTARPEAR